MFALVLVLLASCKALFPSNNKSKKYVKVREYGKVIKIPIATAEDTIVETVNVQLEKYPVSECDSMFMQFDQKTHEIRYYLLEEQRYVVLNQFYEILWYESK